MATYTVSYVEGDSEAWMSRFLSDLQRELDRQAPGRFVRVTDGGAEGPPGDGDGLHGARTADVMLALCSPAYFGDARVDREWAIAVHRRMLGQARTGIIPQTVLPVIWKPLVQRLPAAVVLADTLPVADLPPLYRSHGLARLTMHSPRLRDEYRVVLSAIAGHLVSSAADSTPPPALEESVSELPGVLAAGDAPFTQRFRAFLRSARPFPDGHTAVDVPRRARLIGAGDGTGLPRERLPDLGRRILLLGPPGSGRGRELAWLARAVLEAEDGAGPWGCEVAFPLTAGPGGIPDAMDLVQAVAPDLHPEEPAGWAMRQLRSGRALLTVQGMEAVPERSRGSVWERLLQLLRDCPQSPGVVAADGFRLPWDRLDTGYARCCLEPWSPAESASFLRLAAPSAHRAGEDLAEVRQRLILMLEHDRVLRDLMAWPGAAAGVWAAVQTADSAPEPSRQELLRTAVASQWMPGAAGKEARAEYETEGAPEGPLRAAAGRLAAAAVLAGGAGLSGEAAVEVVAAGRGQGGSLSSADGRQLLESLTDRSGVVYQPGPDLLLFAHVSLRDYLAAHHLLTRGAVEATGFIAEHVAQSGSPELGLLVAELASPEQRDALLAGLLDRHTAAGTEHSLLLTAAVAAAAAGCGTAVADRLRAALKDLGPLNGEDLALAARGGTRLLDLLPPPGHDGDPWDALRTLLSPAAGDAGTDSGRPGPEPTAASTAHRIGGSVTGRGPGIRRLSARPFPPPDRPFPAEAHSPADLRHLAGLPQVGEVHCHGPIEDLGPLLAGISGMRSLVLAGHPGLAALPDLTGCRSLRVLRVRDCPELRDIRSLAGSGVVFAELDPWTPDIDLGPLRSAGRLCRVDLVMGRGAPVRVRYLGQVQLRIHAPGGVVDAALAM